MITLDHRQLLAGDPAATEAFLAYLRRYIRRFLLDPSRVREVSQSAFAEIMAKLRAGVDPKPEHIYYWVATCASNAIRRELTQQRHRAIAFESQLHTQLAPDPLELVQARRHIERIERLLEQFKPRAQLALTGAALGQTDRELAELLGVSPGAARMVLSRARKKLEHDLTIQERLERMRLQAQVAHLHRLGVLPSEDSSASR